MDDIHDDMVREIRKLKAAHTELLKQAKDLRKFGNCYNCEAMTKFDKYIKEQE